LKVLEELFNLTYKDEVELLKDEDDFEALGDEKYLNHPDMEARLYWAFCRPNGSCEEQIADVEPLVSIMAFNHSKLPALRRFQLLNDDVIKKDNLRVKIRNRTRMLFRAMVDNDFTELNQVLDIVPVFLPVAIDQLKTGRKWNDIKADEIEATKFIKRSSEFIDNEYKESLFLKLQDFEEYDESELKEFLQKIEEKKDKIDSLILEYYNQKVKVWIKHSDIHILQKKVIEKLANKLID
jgi:transcription termination factor NusB